MRKTFTLFGRAILTLLVLVIGLLLVSATVNGVMTSVERSTHSFPGRYVEVSGKRIHTYTVGWGDTNVVLLSGLGTPSPVLDFLPLIQELKTKCTVTVIEYPGYGLSDDTDQSRETSESVEEIREVLRKIDVKPPYILVPHSISGLQALLYSNKYPEEIAGVVGLDISVPKQLDFIRSSLRLNSLYFYWYEFLRVSGITRIALFIDPSLSGVMAVGLSPEEVTEYNMITNWIVPTHAVNNETKSIPQNMQLLANLKFPPSIPVIFVLASESVDRDAPGIPGAAWKKMHEEIVENVVHSKIVILNGSHYIHHGNEKKIASIVFEMSDLIKPK